MIIPRSRFKLLCCHFSMLAMLFLVFLTVCLALSGAEPAEEKERPKIDEEKEKHFWEQIIQAERIDFIISGKVMDEKGASLSNVTMAVEEERSRVWESPNRKNWTKTIDGEFRVKVKRASAVTLMFTKEGYYGADELYFRIPPEMDQTDEIGLADEEGRKPRLKHFVNKLENIQVVLEKKGQLTRLGIFVGGLSYNPDSSGTVIDFDRPPQVSVYDPPRAQKVTNMLDRASFPRNCAYILPDMDAQGQAILKDCRWKEEQMEERVYCLPQRLDLFLSDKSGGFVMSEFGYNKKTMHKMKQAPASGYKQPLSFDATDLLKILLGEGGAEYQSFYFKVGEKYGKGYFMPTAVRVKLGQYPRYYFPMGKDGIVSIGIRFFLQPDGSRNLETEE